MDDQTDRKPMGEVIQIDEARIRDHLSEMVRGTAEEALIEMYLAGVSVRRVEDITGALWGARVYRSTVMRHRTGLKRRVGCSGFDLV